MRHLNKDFPYEKPSKNRSGKDKNLILGGKSILRCVSMEQLKEWANQDVKGASQEYDRRLKKIERRYGKKVAE